jgi:hypothetical protein
MPKELHDKALKLGADDFGYSKTKDKKYFVSYNGKIINFGQKGYSDFTKHKDQKRKKAYWARHSKIKNKKGQKVINDKNSPSYWSARILWQ